MMDRVEQGIPLTSVPGLAVIGQCSIACADHPDCDYFVFTPRILPTSCNYNDCLLAKRVRGEMVYEVGKVTGYPGLGADDCPSVASKHSLYKPSFPQF